MNQLFKYLAVIIPFITAMVYVNGYVYYNSYLAVFGLKETLLPLETAKVFLYFFNLAIPIIMLSLFFCLIAAIIVRLFHLFCLNFILLKIIPYIKTNFFLNRTKRASSSTIKKRNSQMTFDPSVNKSARNLSIAFVLIPFSSIIANYYGFEAGAAKLKSFQQNVHPIEFQLNNKNVGIIACSSLTQLCGVYNHDSHSVELDKISSLHGAVHMLGGVPMFDIMGFVSASFWLELPSIN